MDLEGTKVIKVSYQLSYNPFYFSLNKVQSATVQIYVNTFLNDYIFMEILEIKSSFLKSHLFSCISKGEMVMDLAILSSFSHIPLALNCCFSIH